jgi:hypothetical protein
MQKYSVLFCAIIFTFFFGAAQSIENVSRPIENIHLHLNKTTFIKGERLWFKGYVQDQNTKLPSLSTTNLHVAIYDEKGDEIKRKLLYAENGMANGDFAIDTMFTGENYKVLAWTNYQRNFKQLLPFQQNIRIVKEASEEDISAEDELKIEVYPEGGYLIEDTYNQIGIMLSKLNGEKVSVNNLELVDGLGNLIRSNIATNSLGLGKTGFMVEKGKKYFLQWGNVDNVYSKKILPTAKPDGIGLNIDNNGKDDILVKLIASKSTFKEKDGENYSMAFYQDESIVFEAIEIIEEESVIALQRKSLPYGINTAVLFDEELKPVSYRMFFNHRKDKERINSIAVEHCLSEFGDSIQVDFIARKNDVVDANVSVSVLPSSTKAYKPQNSISSSFLVRPYLQRPFKGAYYFNDIDRKKRFELDKRLLIEGWGKYDWDSRKLEELKLDFALETGISISGKVLDADLTEEKQVSLVTDFSGAYAFEELGSDKSFRSVMNLFEGDSLGISLIGKKGKLRKPKVGIQFSKPISLGLVINRGLNFEEVMSQKENDEVVVIDQSLSLGDRTIALNEVVVTEKAAPKNNKFQITAEIEGRLVSDEDIKRTSSVSSYILKQGFLISIKDGKVDAYVNRHPYPKVPIIIEGMVSSTGEIIGMPLSRVKAITFKKSTNGPFISIQLNPNYVAPENRNKFIKFAVTNGYARPQSYFTPNYPDYTTSIFKNFGVLDWHANVTIGSEIPTSIMIPIKGQRTINLFVEGMNSNGGLFMQNGTITTTEDY